jgi:transposase-like protein
LSHTTIITRPIQRLLRPRTPEDCPDCRHQAAVPTHAPSTCPPIIPWSERKSRRGGPKRITTQGFSCSNRTCPYYRITDAHIHALVGDGVEGKAERIQTLRCQACTTTFSTRRDIPLYRLKTPSDRVAQVLTALAEGLDVSAAARVFGHRQATMLHDRTFRALHLPHVQLDEIRTRLRSRAQGLWLWLTIDPISKIVPVLHLGARTQAAAHAVIHDLEQRLAPGSLPVFTSDGLNLYFYALTAHFGQWIDGTGRQARQWQMAAGLIYGRVKKAYRRRRLVRISR